LIVTPLGAGGGLSGAGDGVATAPVSALGDADAGVVLALALTAGSLGDGLPDAGEQAARSTMANAAAATRGLVMLVPSVR
jgi:hypothetical protein